MYLRLLLRAALLTGLSAAPACAQLGASTPQVNCQGVFRATVASGRPHPHLNACSNRLVPEIVQVVRESAGSAQPAYLARVFTYASPYRDPAIAREALVLAGNASAPRDAQLLGWFLAVSQVRRSIYLRSLGTTPEEWFTREVRNCDWGEPTDVEYFRDNGLDGAFVGELERLAQMVTEDSGRPERVRAYARCLSELLPALID